jgi:hypothetical protein
MQSFSRIMGSEQACLGRTAMSRLMAGTILGDAIPAECK